MNPRKITIAVLSVIISLFSLIVHGSAANILDNAKSMKPLTYYSLSGFQKSDTAIYKITLSKSGTLNFFREDYRSMQCILMKSNGTSIDNDVIVLDSYTGKSTVKNLKKGTYYLVFNYRLNLNNPSVDGYVKDFYYTFEADQKPTVSVAVNVYVGDEIDFSAVAYNYSGKVKWKTTDSKVATVSKGKVTCKKAGKAKIRAYMNNGDYAEITLVVKKK